MGREDDYKTFFFDERLVCNSSKHLKERCLSNNEISIIHFTDQEPIAFYVYFLWVQSEKRKPIIYTPAKYSDEPWLSGGVSAWLLARQLDAPDFEKYALSQFIQNCAAMVYGPWDRIEREVSIISPLRRFSDHWVAWNHYLAGRGRGTEYSRLHAATDLAPFVTDDTRDPRIYDLEHWYEDCGDNLNPRCCHDPILRKEALEEEERLVNTDVPEWGDTFELDGRNRSCMFCHYVARPPQISTPQGTGPGAFVCAFSVRTSLG